MSNEVVQDAPTETPQSKRLNFGLISVVAFAGVVATSLLWSISAGGSYWQQEATASLASPAYTDAEDLRQAPATVPMELGNIDPEATSRTVTFQDPAYREADEPRGAPRTFVPLSTDAADEADLVVASLPASQPMPASLGDGEGDIAEGAHSTGTIGPLVASEPPDQPLVAGSEDTEKALGLNRAERFGVQRRLTLAGFNPNGIDGVFGSNTRAAIADFQTARGFLATGYLEPSVYAELKQRTEDAYQAFRRQRAAARSAAADPAPATEEPLITSANEEGGCARHSDGRIIEYQSLACDVAGFRESFGGPGRDTLENREGAGADR